MTAFWQVRNWNTFQHYSKRTPPWVKMYGALLDTYEFTELSDDHKAHWVCLYLLASRTGNKIPNDPVWVASKISARSPVDLELLARQGLLEPHPDASAPTQPMLAPVEQSRVEQSQRREEKMTDDFVKQVVVAANAGLRDNPAMRQEGEMRPLTVPQAKQVVSDWQKDGIPEAVILTTVSKVALRYKPQGTDRRIGSFLYFDKAVRQAWAEHQVKPVPPARTIREVA